MPAWLLLVCVTPAFVFFCPASALPPNKWHKKRAILSTTGAGDQGQGKGSAAIGPRTHTARRDALAFAQQSAQAGRHGP